MVTCDYFENAGNSFSEIPFTPEYGSRVRSRIGICSLMEEYAHCPLARSIRIRGQRGEVAIGDTVDFSSGIAEPEFHYVEIGIGPDIKTVHVLIAEYKLQNRSVAQGNCSR